MRPLFLAAALALAACTGPSVADDTADGGTSGFEISAAEGGTVSHAGATLIVPAGALAQDTTLTVSVRDAAGVPELASLVGDLYDFGPDGTTFSPAATLTLPLYTNPADGQQAVISWLDGDVWVDLASTATATGVTAPVEHFTTFVVRFVPGADFDCAFTACGGDPTDVGWVFQGACTRDESAEEFCPTAVITSLLTGSGSLQINSGDGRFDVDLQAAGDLIYDLPASCVTEFAACSDLNDPDDPITCTGDPAVGCQCVREITSSLVSSGVYQLAGAQVTFTDDDFPTPQVLDYCVSGTELKLRDGAGTLYVFEAP